MLANPARLIVAACLTIVIIAGCAPRECPPTINISTCTATALAGRPSRAVVACPGQSRTDTIPIADP